MVSMPVPRSKLAIGADGLERLAARAVPAQAVRDDDVGAGEVAVSTSPNWNVRS